MELFGFSNECELFLGILIDKTQFKKKKFIESFYVLSQLTILRIYNKFINFFSESFFNFEKNRLILGKYTYTIAYYFIGCYSKTVNNEMESLMMKFKKNRVFLGLPWLIFGRDYLEIKSI